MKTLQVYSRTRSGMGKRVGLLSLLFLLLTSGLFAQQTLTGVVVEPNGEPVIGANVYIKGSTTGTITDFDGTFDLEAPDDAITLVVSFVGYATHEVPISGQMEFNITLSEDISLDEVVVTALGVERDEKALGYSVQKIGNEQVSAVRPVNVTNALAGKVSGVYVTGSGNGPTASSNITIRGESSLSGNNQALFVVNGMPITNGLFSPGDGLNGSTTIDFGNAAQIVNPDDIESISVLKGPAAAALYGTRAANGVILVTTKTGEQAKGWGVDINTTTTFEDILRLPDYQNEYGFGGYGFYSYDGGSTYTTAEKEIGGQTRTIRYYDAFGENWGPRLDGTPIKQFNTSDEAMPFTPAEGNIRDFFRTGIINTNNISLSNVDETSDFRLSFTNLNRRGIVPNTDLGRNTFQASIGKRLFDEKLRLRFNGMYVRGNSGNVPNAGYDESSSVMYGWLWYPRQVPIDDLKDYWKPGQEGIQQSYVEELWVNNPWLVVNENTNAFQSNRIIGNVEAEYSFLENLSLRFRLGADLNDEQRQFRRAPSTRGVLLGSYREDDLSFSETNTELLLSWGTSKRDNSLFDLDLKLGGNLMRQKSNFLIANNPQLLLFGTDESVFSLTNNRSGVLSENPQAEKGINSVFGLASFSYNNFIYLDVTGRNDWSSTLPTDNNSFFYPSASLSLVLTDALGLSTTSALSFLKLRGAYAEVGNDTDPYLLDNYFDPEPLFGSNPAFTTAALAGNPDLKPERTTSYEFGVDARFLNNRLSFDATYYNMLTSDQIIFLPTAVTSGKESQLVNAGEIRNKGVEFLMNARAVDNPGFTWDVTLNVGHNRAIVESLPEGVEDSYPLVADVYPGDEGSADLELVAVEGELLGQLRGLGFQRDDNGNIIHENGLPLLTEEKVLAGSYQPDLRAGIYNTFGFGNFSFGFLFDGQFGGNIYSRTHALMNTGGTITNNDDPNLDLSTLEGRPEYDITYDAEGEPVYDLIDAGGVVGPGVKFDNDGNLVENDVSVPTRDYFYAYYGNGFNRDNIEAATFDATYIKLREMRLSYQLPQRFISNIGLQQASVSLVGRNLLLFTDVPSIDPETYSIRNGRFVNGFESTQLPSTRSFGFSINIGF